MPRLSRVALGLVVAAALAALAVVLPGTSAPAANAATADVSIVNTSFNPSTITINVGDTVHWSNDETTATAHTVTSGTSPTPDGTFDSSPNFPSGELNPGQTFDFTFTSAGTFSYFCKVHPTTMFGTVVVQAAQATATTAPAATSTTAPTSTTAAATSTIVATTPGATTTAPAARTATPRATAAAGLPGTGTGGSGRTAGWLYVGAGAFLLMLAGGAFLLGTRRVR